MNQSKTNSEFIQHPPFNRERLLSLCDNCSCLDAAYERLAILEGVRMPKTAQFPENKEFFKDKIPPCVGHAYEEQT